MIQDLGSVPVPLSRLVPALDRCFLGSTMATVMGEGAA